MKEKTQTITESVKVDTSAMEVARKVKAHTGIPIGVFISKAIKNEADRLPKAVREKINQS